MIIGINLKSIKADVDRSKAIKGNINIGSTPKIENIEKRNINISGLKDVLFIDFSFETKYNPEIGNITMKGEVLYQSEDFEKILKKWKKEKKVDDKFASEILNAIFRKCLTKSIDLSSELGLPPPIAFPVVKPKEQKNEYIG